MKQTCILISFMLISFVLQAQNNKALSPFDGDHWGVVIEHPDTKKINVEKNISYGSVNKRELHFDIYLPLNYQPGEKRTTIVLLNGIGDQPDQPALKDASIYTSWARLLAAHGYVAVTMESEINNVEASFTTFFQYLDQHGPDHHIDPRSIGVQAFSANCREVTSYLMSIKAPAGIRAAVLYYGESPRGPFRPDLPVLFVVSELDIRQDNYATLWTEILKNKSPWTLTIANDMPHAFDAFSDTEVSKRMIMNTLSYWTNQLRPVPVSEAPASKERAIVAARYEDTEKMLRLMREWMAEHPDTKDSKALSVYVAALVDRNDFAEAEKYLKRSISLDPSNKGNYLNMALIDYALGKPKEAETQLKLYEKDATPEGFTYGYIANRLFGVNKFTEAAINYEKAISFPNPRDFMYYNLGCCYAMLGSREKAFQNLFKAADMGLVDKAGYASDEKLQKLHNDPKWTELMTRLR